MVFHDIGPSKADNVSPLPLRAHVRTTMAEQTLGNGASHLTLRATIHFFKYPFLPHSITGTPTSFFLFSSSITCFRLVKFMPARNSCHCIVL